MEILFILFAVIGLIFWLGHRQKQTVEEAVASVEAQFESKPQAQAFSGVSQPQRRRRLRTHRSSGRREIGFWLDTDPLFDLLMYSYIFEGDLGFSEDGIDAYFDSDGEAIPNMGGDFAEDISDEIITPNEPEISAADVIVADVAIDAITETETSTPSFAPETPAAPEPPAAPVAPEPPPSYDPPSPSYDSGGGGGSSCGGGGCGGD